MGFGVARILFMDYVLQLLLVPLLFDWQFLGLPCELHGVQEGPTSFFGFRV